MGNANEQPQVHRGFTLTDCKKIKFPKKRPGLLKQLIDECHEHYGGNLHGWMLAKLAESVPSRREK